MKYTAIMIVLLMLALPVFAQDKQEVAVEKLFISVSGMTCDMCKGKVETGLREAAGVTKAEVGLEKGISYIEIIPGKTELKKLEDVILALGYGANDRKPDDPHVHDPAMHEEEHKADQVEMQMITFIGEGDMKYTCPMPECMMFSSDKDARCTECGMKLKAMDAKDNMHLLMLQETHKVKKIKK
ncbi:heavy-metal-associated domain-containing protein [candidate division KSB1 bacterium]